MSDEYKIPEVHLSVTLEDKDYISKNKIYKLDMHKAKKTHSLPEYYEKEVFFDMDCLTIRKLVQDLKERFLYFVVNYFIDTDDQTLQDNKIHMNILVGNYPMQMQMNEMSLRIFLKEDCIEEVNDDNEIALLYLRGL